jgi:hypothetical protein
MLKTFEEELSYEHVVLVIIASIASPILILTAVSVIYILKRRRTKDQERHDRLATLQNEENLGLNLRKSNSDLHILHNLKKETNLLFQSTGPGQAEKSYDKNTVYGTGTTFHQGGNISSG